MEINMAGGKSLAFKMRGDRLIVTLEGAVPRATLQGETYFVTESPSIMVGGRKHFVEEIC